jgi:hypothetical protein
MARIKFIGVIAPAQARIWKATFCENTAANLAQLTLSEGQSASAITFPFSPSRPDRSHDHIPPGATGHAKSVCEFRQIPNV